MNKLLFIGLASLVVAGFFVQVLPIAIAAQQTDPDAAKLPAALTASEEKSVVDRLLADKSVTDHFENMKHIFVGISHYTNNFNDTNPTWMPVAHFNVEKVKTLSVYLDEGMNRVLKVEEGPYVQIGLNAAMASNYYTGASTLNGLRMNAVAPTYTANPTPTNILSAFLVNAVEAGSDSNFLCDPGHFPNSYFAQSGFAYTTSVKAPSWSDTAAQCAVQGGNIPYRDGNSYEFKVVVVGTTWHMIGKNTTNNTEAFDMQRTGVTFLSFMTNTINTSVWTENQNTGTTWYQKYASPYTVSATASMTTNNGATWSNWDSASKIDHLCSGSNQADTVISGNVVSGGTGTWNLQTFSSLHC